MLRETQVIIVSKYFYCLPMLPSSSSFAKLPNNALENEEEGKRSGEKKERKNEILLREKAGKLSKRQSWFALRDVWYQVVQTECLFNSSKTNVSFWAGILRTVHYMRCLTRMVLLFIFYFTVVSKMFGVLPSSSNHTLGIRASPTGFICCSIACPGVNSKNKYKTVYFTSGTLVFTNSHQFESTKSICKFLSEASNLYLRWYSIGFNQL